MNGADSQTIITQRAFLEEAPLFAAFFASEHYLRGARFNITLPHQSVTCIHAALRVLMRLHPSPTDDLRRYLGDFLHADKVAFLAGLCRLAVHLRADLLEHVARALLTEIEHLITPEDCVAMVGIIYNGDVAPSAFLRAYVLAAFRQHERTLRGYAEGGVDRWGDVMRAGGPALIVDLEMMDEEAPVGNGANGS